MLRYFVSDFDVVVWSQQKMYQWFLIAIETLKLDHDHILTLYSLLHLLMAWDFSTISRDSDGNVWVPCMYRAGIWKFMIYL